MVEVIVSVTRGEVDRWEVVRDVRPALQIEESIMVLAALHAHPEWNAALDRRGIEDRSLVQIDPWPAGHVRPGPREGPAHHALPGLPAASPRRTTATPGRSRACWPSSTWAGARCSRWSTSASSPSRPESGSYYPEDNGPLRTDLKPLEITQPEGPSFEVEGNLVRWQKWSMRVGMDPLEGLVLYTVGYEDGGRVRPSSTGPR